jgi:hypothetical protein
MVQGVPDQLATLFFRAAAIFRRDVRHFRLEFRTRIQFHGGSPGAELAIAKSPRRRAFIA